MNMYVLYIVAGLVALLGVFGFASSFFFGPKGRNSSFNQYNFPTNTKVSNNKPSLPPGMAWTRRSKARH